MEREPSPVYSNASATRTTRAPPVLQVNVLYGMNGEETAGNAAAVGVGPLGSNNNNGGSSSATTVAQSAINISRAVTTANFSTYNTGSVTRRVYADGVGSNASLGGGPLSAPAAGNGGGMAGAASPLAKPVLDPAQVRCCPLDQWIPDAHVVNCMAPDCTNNFSLFNRKHRCRMCGRVFCGSCCNNLVYISARAMPSGLTEAVNGGGSSSGGGGGGSNGYTTSSAVTPEPAGAAAAAAGLAYGVSSSSGGGGAISSGGSASTVGSTNGGGVRYGGEDSSAASSNPSIITPSVTSQASSEVGGTPYGSAAGGTTTSTAPAVLVPNSVVSSPVLANVVSCRVCASCYYEVQLVVSTRQENGEVRRRSRGELKMLQRVLLVNVMTYLTLRDLVCVALTSADFYFLSRDNIIWYQYNMTRWQQEGEATQLSTLKSRAAALRAQQQRSSSWYGGGGAAAASSLGDDIFNSASVIQDATALSESEAAKRVISLHARYNYTQFLDFARRQEMARCEGLSSFSLGARILLSSPIRVALVGPSGIGKSAAVQSFLGEKATQMIVRPTIGFRRRAVSVRLAGGLSTEVTLHVYDLSGADRYEQLRRFVCRHCHVIGLCYDPAQKVTLVQAADVMMELESALGPQPVVVCGLVRKAMQQQHHHINPTSGGAAASAGLSAGAPLSSALPTSRSSGALNDSRARRTLALEEHSGTSAPLQRGSAVGSPSAGGASFPKTDREVTTRATAAGAAPAIIGAPAGASTEVTVEDAVGITVRGLSSIQCPMLHSTPLFEALVQALLDRLAEATVASTTTISEISAELTMQGDFSPPNSTTGRMMSTTMRSAPASVVRSSVRRRRPAASRKIVQDLLNLTMQPCALDILLDRK